MSSAESALIVARTQVEASCRAAPGSLEPHRIEEWRTQMRSPGGYLREWFRGSSTYQLGEATVSKLVDNLNLNSAPALIALVREWRLAVDEIRRTILSGPEARGSGEEKMAMVRRQLQEFARENRWAMQLDLSRENLETLVAQEVERSLEALSPFRTSIPLSELRMSMASHQSLMSKMIQLELKEPADFPSAENVRELTLLAADRERIETDLLAWVGRLQTLMATRSEFVTPEFVADLAETIAAPVFKPTLQSENVTLWEIDSKIPVTEKSPVWTVLRGQMADYRPFLTVQRSVDPPGWVSPLLQDAISLELVRLGEAEAQAVHGEMGGISLVLEKGERASLFKRMFHANKGIQVRTPDSFQSLAEPHLFWMTEGGVVLVHHSLTELFPKGPPLDEPLPDLLQSRQSRAMFWDEIHAACGEPFGPPEAQ